MDLSITNFSHFGSYMSLDCQNVSGEPAFYLKSLHGVSKPEMKSLRFFPTYQGRIIRDFTAEADWASVTIRHAHGQILLTFADASRLVLEGTGKDCGLKIDAMPAYNFEYSYLLGTPQSPFCILNSYKNLCRYLVHTTCGALSLDQKVHLDAKGSFSRSDNHTIVDISSDCSGTFTTVIRDLPTHNALPEPLKASCSTFIEKNRTDFYAFADAFPEVPASYQESKYAAAYILWSSTVAPSGYLNYPSVYASINHFPGVWSWDHCFAALAFAQGHPDLAFAQMAVVFDHQDEAGQLPGSVSDTTIRWNFCKPPIHGLVFSRMCEVCSFSPEQTSHIYAWIKKQVLYYLTYKDSNRDGICEYYHGNDSGQDNSTVFSRQVPTDSPDLTAFLIVSMELLEDLSRQEGRIKDAEYWNTLADTTFQRFLDYFITDGRPVPKESFTGNPIPTDSLLPFVSLLLGKRLPKELRETMIHQLKEQFLTEWGLATEALDSPLYEADAYWRGPIWAPSTWIFIEALEACGETEFARTLAEKFCHMVKLHGFAENFNALTGEGLRDKSFSWTAGTFLYLAHKLTR